MGIVHWFDSEVWPNLVANVVWGAPAFVTSHLLLRRHITRTAQQPGAPEQTEVAAP